jgi:hypothetical protein
MLVILEVTLVFKLTLTEVLVTLTVMLVILTSTLVFILTVPRGGWFVLQNVRTVQSFHISFPFGPTERYHINMR